MITDHLRDTTHVNKIFKSENQRYYVSSNIILFRKTLQSDGRKYFRYLTAC